MEIEETKVTTKYQTTVPKSVRKFLKISPGSSVTWHVVKELVFLDVHMKIKDPVKVLTSKIKMNLDAVMLVNEARGDFG